MTVLQSLDGCLYRWGAKGPSRFDCSGAVTHSILKAGGEDWRDTHNAQSLFDACDVAQPSTFTPGMLAFYGAGSKGINHVMTLLRPDSSGSWIVYGACGGNHFTTNDLKAMAMKAKVQERPRLAYRFDLVAVKAMPWAK